MKNLLYLGALMLLFSCSTTKSTSTTSSGGSSTFRVVGVSTDPTYGLSETNPVQVGGADKHQGPVNERKYLDALAGPNGEKISYYRHGSCCPIKSDNDPFGFGSVMLDNYRVTWEGADDTVSIYINMYDYGTMEAPVGFTLKK